MKEYIVAIELGSSKIVAAAGYRDKNGALVVEAIEKENAINIIKRGCVQNIEEVFSCIKKLKTKLENRLTPAKITRTYVGVSGISVYAEDKTAHRTFQQDSIIQQQDIVKLKNECSSTMPSTVDTLAIVPTEYIIDNRSECNPIGVTGTNIEARYKVITANPVLKRNINRCIVERAKLPIADYITTALATADVVLSKDERTLGCMLVDFGAETTTVSIYKNDALIHLITLPMGGRNITRDISSLNLISSEAEQLKISSGKAQGYKSENNVRLRFEGDNHTEIDLATLSSVVEARSEEIIANVEEQIKRAGLEKKDIATGIVVLGSAAKLSNWNALLEERTGLKVRPASLLKEILVVEKEQAHVGDYMQAVGLLYAATETCTKTIRPVIPETEEEDDEEEEIMVKPIEKEEKKKDAKRPSIFKKWKDKFGNFINEGETDDEKDEE